MTVFAQAEQVKKTCSCVRPIAGDHQCATCEPMRPSLQQPLKRPDRLASLPRLVREVIGSPGRPLDPVTRQDMEASFAADFSQVRVHTDSKAAESARQVSALAYTAGNHIAFATGTFSVGAINGRRLLAHELAHVVQQGQPAGELGMRGSAEGEAHVAAARAVDGHSAMVRTGAMGLQRQQDPAEGTVADQATTSQSPEQNGLPPDRDYMTDPTYVDNIRRMSYDVLTGQLEVLHQDGIWLALPVEKVSRNVSTITPEAATRYEKLAEKHGIALPRSEYPPPTGRIEPRLRREPRFRRIQGHIYPDIYDDASTPNIRDTWRKVEAQIVPQSRKVLLDIAVVAGAARGVAGGALASKAPSPTPSSNRVMSRPPTTSVTLNGRQLPIPQPASGSATANFGRATRWGRNAGDATARVAELQKMAPAAARAEAQRLAEEGITAAMAREWADYYRSEVLRSAARSVSGSANPAAGPRAVLMDLIGRILD